MRLSKRRNDFTQRRGDYRVIYPDPDNEELANIPHAIRDELLHLQWTLLDVGCSKFDHADCN
jgi:hypothetical protein